MQNKSILRPAVYVTLLSFGGIILGFLSQLLIAYFFGAGNERDAYFGAIIIPTYIVAVFIGSIGAVFLSFYIKIAGVKSQEDARFFFNNLLRLCFLTLSLLALLLFLFSEGIINLTVPGFSGAQHMLAITMLEILAPTIVFQSLINICGSIYQSRHKFVLPALPSIIAPIINLLFVFLFHEIVGITSLAWGNLLGNALSFSIIYFALYRSKDVFFEFKITISAEIKETLKSATPLILAGVVYRFSGVWERFLASKLSVGSISYLGYANQLLIVFSTLTTGGISTIFFPILSQAWHNKDIESLRRSFRQALTILLYITFPASVIFTFLRVDVIQILFERGAFGHDATIAVADTLAIFMGAFIFQSLGSIVVRSFYFMEKTIAASVIGIIEIIVYITMSVILVKHYSFKGLAFSLSFAAMVNVFISTIITNRTIKYFNKSFILTVIKVISSSFISLFFVYMWNIRLDNIFINVCLISILFLLIYLMFTYILRIELTLTIREKVLKYLSN